MRDDTARRLFPQLQPVDYTTAVRCALANLETGRVETTWSDALASSQGDSVPVMLTTQEGIILERRRRVVPAPAPSVYRACASLGGPGGWLYLNWMWRLRGFVDRLVGGVGLRRGRRDSHALRVGDAVDFWRVEALPAALGRRSPVEQESPLMRFL